MNLFVVTVRGGYTQDNINTIVVAVMDNEVEAEKWCKEKNADRNFARFWYADYELQHLNEVRWS